VEFDPQTFWTMALVLAAALAYRYMPRWRAKSPFVDASVLKRRLDSGDDVVVVDVRTPREFEKGHVPDAVNVPLADLPTRLPAVDADLAALKSEPVFIHCNAEARAAKGARTLRDAGFTDVTVINGGFTAWRRKKFPIETAG